MTKRARGRPRSYDPDTALAAALEAFWIRGFAGTSLDEISAATGMNRPSLYAAFGDKRSIYRKALERFNGRFLGDLETALFAGSGLEQDLVGFYLAALPTYGAGAQGALGCPVICTATTEAAVDGDIQADLAAALDHIDQMLARRFQQARDEGALTGTATPEQQGRLAAALLHSLAVRMRARQSGFDPGAFVRASVTEILGG